MTARRRRAQAPVLAAAVFGALLLAACDEKKPAAPAGQSAAPPPAVLVVKAERRDITQGTEFVGRIEALERVDIRARVTGFLRERTFVEGQQVKAGDLLFLIEREPFEAEVALRQAELENAQATLNNATLQVNRGKELVRTNNIPQSTQDQRVADQQVAAAKVSAAQASLQQARIQLGYTQITSPIDGRVGRASLTPGNVVGPDSGVLTTVVRQDPMRVVFPVTQRQLLDIRTGENARGPDQVQVRLRLADGNLYDGVGAVNFLDVKTDRSTDSVLVQANIPNPKDVLSDGQFIGVVVEDRTPQEALLIPQAAVQIDQAGPFVLVVGAGDKVEQKRVTLGQGMGANVVVNTGIDPGALVITEGAQRARPGSVVAPRPMPAVPQPGAVPAPRAG